MKSSLLSFKKLIPGLCLGLMVASAWSQNKLTDKETEEGYGLLFDGTLASFKNNFVDYVKDQPTSTGLDAGWILDAANSAVTMTTGKLKDIRSKITYSDFDLRLTYQCDANQGIFYRVLLRGDRPWITGVEFAINVYTTSTKDSPGAAYDLYSPTPPAYKPGQWNTVRIVALKDSVEHWLNGTKVVGFKLHSKDFWDKYNVSKWNADNDLTNKVKGNRNSGYIDDGYIGFQGDHGGKWKIRDLRIGTKNVCLGPLDATTGTACPTTGVGAAAAAPKFSFSALRRSGLEMTLDFQGASVTRAEVIGLDGKVLGRGALFNGGSQAVFSGDYRTGLYFLRAKTSAGEVTRKLNLL
jgi:hypothetical protein